MQPVLFLSFYLNANTVNASDRVDKPAAAAAAAAAAAEWSAFTKSCLFLISSSLERLQKDVTTD